MKPIEAARQIYTQFCNPCNDPKCANCVGCTHEIDDIAAIITQVTTTTILPSDYESN